MSQPLKTFTIERKTWARGGNTDDLPLLLDGRTGMKCCLGFYALSCGIEQRKIIGVGVPEGIKEVPDEMNWLLTENGYNSDEAENLITINDSEEIEEADRETELIAHFALHNALPIFVDELPTEANPA